jgi:hypothetical protein
MSIDEFVNSVVNNDGHSHAIDFARILNESTDKDFLISTFLDELNRESRLVLEDEMDIVI